MRFRHLLLIISAVTVAACSGPDSSGVAVPKRRAYPRIEPYPEMYEPVPGIPVRFEINSDAGFRADSSGYLFDVAYERFGAVLHCTYSPVTRGSAAHVLDNRYERMDLNLGENTAELLEIGSGRDVNAVILTSPSAEVTPVQFLATDSVSFVLSGALVIERSGTPDSIFPILQSVKRDLVHGLSGLSSL